MAETRLNCLIDLLLVVGSDNASKLVRRKSSKVRPKIKRTSESRNNPSARSPLAPLGEERESNSNSDSASASGSYDAKDFMLQLTDPDIDYNAQVSKNMFTDSVVHSVVQQIFSH